MRRLGIFVFYDPEGIVDTYVEYLLDSLRPLLSELVILVNGKITEAGRKRLEVFSDGLLLRENAGFDAGAIREYLLSADLNYDEIVCFNDTFYGPFYPFSEVFREMDGEDCDFWSLTKHGVSTDWGGLPEHLQSYFLVFRRRLIESETFHEFWTHLKTDYATYRELVYAYEVGMTQSFTEAGFKGEAFVKDDALNTDPAHTYTNFLMYPGNLITRYRCPVIKRKALTIDLQYVKEMQLAEALQYIQRNTDYRLDLIYENVLRRYDLINLKNNFDWDYVLPEKRVGDYSSTAQIFYAHEKMSLSEAIECAYERQADYLCYASSAKQDALSQIETEEGFRDNVLHLMESEEKLGMLVAPLPLIGEPGLEEDWEENFAAYREEAVRLGIADRLNPNKPSYQTGPFCLLKMAAIHKAEAFCDRKVLLECPEDFLSHCFLYLLQEFGYYTGTIRTVSEAEYDMMKFEDMIADSVGK